MVIDFGENIMTVLMIGGSIVAIMMVIACALISYSRGFDWGGLYEHFDRVSCWCCPLKNNKELMQLYMHYPDLWQELRDMDNRAYNKFKGKGVDFYEKKIIQKLRNVQMNLFKE